MLHVNERQRAPLDSTALGSAHSSLLYYHRLLHGAAPGCGAFTSTALLTAQKQGKRGFVWQSSGVSLQACEEFIEETRRITWFRSGKQPSLEKGPVLSVGW
ncbi:hypothetical protein SRHO_G00207740 [Serrasalmus rhombeus]